MPPVNANAEEKKRCVGVYLTVSTCEKLKKVAKRKEIETGFKHTQSDIIKLAINELLKQNGLV